MEQTRPEHRPIPTSGAGAHLCLYLVLCGERPLLGGMAFDLGGVHELTLGRGGPLGASVRGPGQARIDVPDPTMSGAHARLAPADDGSAVVEDLGSRNGTRVRGQAATRAVLRDGDWFMVGRSVFLLRRVTAPIPAGPLRPPGASRLV